MSAPAPFQSICLPRRAHARVYGTIDTVRGLCVEARGVKGEVGDVCTVEIRGRQFPLEIVGFRESSTFLLPLDRVTGIAPGTRILCTEQRWHAPVGRALLGRVVDGLGRPLDNGPPLTQAPHRDLHAEPPPSLQRPPVERMLETGVRCIDLAHSLGNGQRVGIFAGSGVGKSTLLGMLLRNAQADAIVLALIGERGREVRHFLDRHLDPRRRERTAVVAATSDRPALQRIQGAHLAATLAESLRDEGANVLLVMDSATRFAMALREAGLAAGEPPTQRGYPPSLYSELPRLVERFGTSEHGSITALLTVLVEGDDLNDPAADCLRGLLDGHLVLSRRLAEAGQYPPVDPLASLSRLMPDVTSAEHLALAHELRAALALYDEYRDLIEVGAYRRGSEPRLDRVLEIRPAVQALLAQREEEDGDFATALEQLGRLLRPKEGSS